MIQKFFEIYNFRFWLFLFELFFIPFGMVIGGLIHNWIHDRRGLENEIQ